MRAATCPPPCVAFPIAYPGTLRLFWKPCASIAKVTMTRDQLVARLKRAGELQISGEDQPELDSYFDTIHFRFHGPDGFEADYSGLTLCLRMANASSGTSRTFSGLTITVGWSRNGYGPTIGVFSDSSGPKESS